MGFNIIGATIVTGLEIFNRFRVTVRKRFVEQLIDLGL